MAVSTPARIAAGVVAGLSALSAAGMAPSPARAQDASVRDSILVDQRQLPLDERQIDPLNRVIDLLERSARAGPRFEPSAPSVDVDTIVGTAQTLTVQIANRGDEPGVIERVSLLGQMPGLALEHDCAGGEVFDGESCPITLQVSGDAAASVQTVLLVQVVERDPQNPRRIEIPVSVRVSPPPPPPPAPEPEPEPEPVLAPAPPEGPSPEQVARRYFQGTAVPSRFVAAPRRGFARVSPPPPQIEEAPSVFGADRPVVTARTTDPRYDESLPWARASLPVDRRNILTADRVVKAILETPVTSVMCGQVVAVVESDVYSATSSEPLIRAGSRILGSCGSFVSERVSISWNRIITTDGRSVTLGAGRSETADAMGQGGAVGREFIPFFDQYVLPVFSSIVDIAAALALIEFGEEERIQINDETNRTVESRSTRNEGLRIATEGVRANVTAVINEIRDIRRKVIIPAGSRIDVNLREDVYFPDSQDEVQIADMVYRVEDQPRSSMPLRANPAAFLEPFSPGAAPGPVVVVDGRRFIVRGGAPAALDPQTTATLSPEEADRRIQDQIRAQIAGGPPARGDARHDMSLAAPAPPPPAPNPAGLLSDPPPPARR